MIPYEDLQLVSRPDQILIGHVLGRVRRGRNGLRLLGEDGRQKTNERCKCNCPEEHAADPPVLILVTSCYFARSADGHFVHQVVERGSCDAEHFRRECDFSSRQGKCPLNGLGLGQPSDLARRQ